MKTFIKGTLAAALVFIKAVSALADALPEDGTTATPSAKPKADKTTETKAKPAPAPASAAADDGLGDDFLNDPLDAEGLGEDVNTANDSLDDDEPSPALAASKYTADQTMKKLMELKAKLGSKDIPMKLMARAINDPKTPCVIANVPADKLDSLYAEAVKRIKAAG
jgi:hypothetical protein